MEMFMLLHFTVLVLTLGLSSDAAPPERKILKDLDVRPLCPCGSSVQSKSTRVVGGVNAVKGQFPYATGIIHHRPGVDFRSASLPLPFCGGTLISDRHILTAAHCLNNRNVNEIFLDVGDFNLETKEAKRLRNATILRMNPLYKQKNFQNDVGVIEMDEPVDWSNGLRAAWIASPDIELREGTPVSVYGWGRLEYSGGRSPILQTLEIPVVSNEECQKGFRTEIFDGMICAGGQKGHDACIGDSGSGLTIRLDNKYALVGVVSFGKNCALPHVAGVYTRLGRYLDWVYEQTRNSSCKPCITE